MFLVFILGWTPSVMLYIVEYFTSVSSALDAIFFVMFQLALLADIIDLFLYNHEVRKYLIGLCLPCCRS